MSRWSNLLLDYDYMKDNAYMKSSMVKLDMIHTGRTSVQSLGEAAGARFMLDRLLLDEDSLRQKWAQIMVHDYDRGEVIFRGSEKECMEFIHNHSKTYFSLELYYALPDEKAFSWTWYFDNIRKRCKIEID